MQKELQNILDNFLSWNNVQPILCSESNVISIINFVNNLDLADLQELRENIFPNIFLFETEDKTFKIERTRDIIEKSSIKPWENFNIFVIREIDKFSIAASNSLLKLFEDVPERLLIILTTSAKDNLLETIRSRILDFWSDDAIYEISPENKIVVDNFFSWYKTAILDIIFWDKILRNEYIAILEYLLFKLKQSNNTDEKIINKILNWIIAINTTNTNPKYVLDTIILEL